MPQHRQLHLGLNLRGIGFHGAAWRHPDSTPERIYDIDYYVEIARIAERGKFDAIFLADVLGAFAGDARSHQNVVAWPLDPFSILSGVAAATSHIGLIGTLSTTYNDPYDLARRVGALDLLSGGRAAVNLVTSAGDSVARNFGYDRHAEHADRYNRAHELATLINALWDSTPGPLEYHGERFEVTGSLGLEPSPQGRPVIVQAGASEQGLSFAGAFAEAVFAASSDIPTGVKLYDELKRRTVAAGRPRTDINVLPGVVPYLGSTEAEARRVYDELEELLVDEGAVAKLGQELGIDLTSYDPDGPVPVASFPAVEGYNGSVSRLVRLRTWAVETQLSLRRFAQLVYRNLGVIHWTPVGTPEQIADELETWFRAGAADGFNILVPQHLGQLEIFVDHVVPILQARGLFREEYTSTTLRGHLGLTVPGARRSHGVGA